MIERRNNLPPPGPPTWHADGQKYTSRGPNALPDQVGRALCAAK